MSAQTYKANVDLKTYRLSTKQRVYFALGDFGYNFKSSPYLCVNPL